MNISIKLKCDYLIASWFGLEEHYTCFVYDQQIPENKNPGYFGEHKPGHNLKSVTAIWYKDCKLKKFPQKLKAIFPNLRVISIYGSDLKSLSKSDLVEYKTFETISCNSNKIEYLPGDLLEGFVNLKSFSFSKNNLNFIEPNILDGHDNLKHVAFRTNPNYDKCFSEYSKEESNATLQEVKNDLFEKFHLRFSNMQAKKHLFLDLENFTKDETFKDFKIIINDSEFLVHRFLLAARSPILAEILRNNPEAENLKLVDISVEIFELILKFLYTDELPRVERTNFLHLFAAAGKLKIEQLKSIAAEEISKEINAENVLEILNLSNKYRHDELRQKSFEEIKKIYSTIEFKDEWSEDIEKLTKIIKAFKIREEMMRKAEEEFKNLLF